MAILVAPAALEDELVEGDAVRQAHLQYQLHQRAVVVASDVGGLAPQMLRVARTAHNLIQRCTSVAAVDVDGLAVCLADGVEDVVDEGDEVLSRLFIRGVVDVVVSSTTAVRKFAKCKVFHAFLFSFGQKSIARLATNYAHTN